MRTGSDHPSKRAWWKCHTSEIFGDPAYRYSYRQAVVDGYLIDHEPPLRIGLADHLHAHQWRAPVVESARALRLQHLLQAPPAPLLRQTPQVDRLPRKLRLLQDDLEEAARFVRKRGPQDGVPPEEVFP